MARKVTLRTCNDDFVISWWGVKVDICDSHTMLFTKNEIINLISPIESIDLNSDTKKTVIYFKSGFYLVIVR